MPATLSARLKSIENEKNKSKKPSIGKEFSFSDFILLDNKFYLIAEKNFTQVITNTSTDKRGFVGPSSSYKVHNSFGMIVFELNKEGNINWYNYIPKLQSYNSIRLYQYHSTMVKNNKLHIIYNDEPKNVDYALSSSKRPKVFNNGKKMHLVMISFEENGKANKTVLGDNEQMETNILIPRSFQTKGDRFFLYGYQFFSKENRLGLATFK